MIGSGGVIINLCLILASASNANFANFGNGPTPGGVGAVTAFSILLLMTYSAFTGFVVVYRDTLLPPPSMASQDSEGLPPPSFATGEYGGSANYGGSVGGDYPPSDGINASGVL